MSRTKVHNLERKERNGPPTTVKRARREKQGLSRPLRGRGLWIKESQEGGHDGEGPSDGFAGAQTLREQLFLKKTQGKTKRDGKGQQGGLGGRTNVSIVTRDRRRLYVWG